jgi:hypothetical protein
MTRPITLFTGQWADLPFEEVARLAGEWGFDGWRSPVGAITWTRQRISRRTMPIFRASWTSWKSTTCRCTRSPTTSPGRPCAMTRSTNATKDILSPEVWGDGDPEGVRTRAAEVMKTTARQPPGSA